jgi:poly(3-hydroxybutyrate) depolymerase
MSYGGLFTYSLGIDSLTSRHFAALAPVAGGILKGFAPSSHSLPPHLALLDIHGWYDPWVSIADYLR